MSEPTELAVTPHPPEGDYSLMLFDIIGTYFVKTYWNGLYKVAMDNKQKNKFPNLEESYKSAVDSFTLAVSKRENVNENINKNYVAIVRDLFKETKEYINHIHTISDFIDYIMRQFVPPEYFKSLSHQSSFKESMFRNILKNALTKFSIFTIDELDVVLNEKERSRNWKSHTETWQKKFIEIMINEKKILYKHLLAQKHNVKIEDSTETVPKEVCEKLLVKIKEYNDTLKKQLEKEEKLMKYIELLKNQISSKDRIIQNMITQLQSMNILDENGNVILTRRKQPKQFTPPQTQTYSPTQQTYSPTTNLSNTPQNSSPEPDEFHDTVTKLATANYSDDEFNEEEQKPNNFEEITNVDYEEQELKEQENAAMMIKEKNNDMFTKFTNKNKDTSDDDLEKYKKQPEKQQENQHDENEDNDSYDDMLPDE